MSSVQDFSCIFCKENFEDKETLQIHFRKHGDPKFDQTAKAKVRCQSDSPTSFEALKEENETVSCDVCDESFPTISKAITHKHKFHPDHDAKYFCPWCGKLFTLKHLYNKHMQSAHDSAVSNATTSCHCDCCNVDFFNPSAMIYHNKFFHRQDTDLPDIGHSKKVKLISQELVQIYYCPFCGEEYNNKINLHKHTKDEHSDEDQNPENILRCPLCEAVFYHLDAYELHLTFHSSEDLYSEENEMLKQIVEFSLDTVPPLMEKMEIPAPDGEIEDLNAMGIDQFLQLTMSKDPEDEQPESMEKTKSKKHKKHKKSKKTITLDEFLNMNSDVFGEGLNVHGIEEVPTRIVTKQLNKPKKEQVSRNNQKLVSSSDIDKLKKQGITIKMKSGKRLSPTKISQLPSISTMNKTIPRKSNLISTSSEVLSKLMNQSNSQVKIIRRGSPSSNSMEKDTNETNFIMEPSVSEENTSFIEEKVDEENKELGKDDTDISKETNTKMNIIALPDVTSYKTVDDCHKSPDSLYNPQNTDSNNIASVNKSSCHNDDKIKDTDPIDDRDQDKNSITEVMKLDDLNNLNKDAADETLNDFEEELASTTILRSNITDDANESQFNDKNVNNSESGENFVQDIATDNTLNAIKHLSGLITVKSVNQSTLLKDDDNLNTSSHKQVDNSVIEEEDENFENDFKKEMNTVDINMPENQKESTNKTLSALKNLSKHVTIKSLSSQVSSPPSREVAMKSDEESDDDGLTNDAESAELSKKGLAQNIVGRKVVNLKQPNKPIMTNNSQIVFPVHTASKISTIKKSFDEETKSETDDSIKSTSNADLLKRLTNVTAKPIPSRKPFQASKQSYNIKDVSKQEKINEEIEIFNIDDSDSDGQEKEESISNIKTSQLRTNDVNKIPRSIPKSNEVLRNLGKNITVKPKDPSNRINQGSFTDEEHFPENNAPFSDDDDDFDNVCKKFDNDMNQFMNQSNKILESTLKNLGKHITVKPKNMSPNNLQRVHLERNTEQNERFYDNDTGSDSDSKTNRVKITEVTDHTASDHEFLSEDDEKHNKNYVIQSPDAAHCDIGENCLEDEHFDKNSNVDSNISQTMAINKNYEKPSQSPVSLQPKESQKCPLSTFKKFNKEITIKSLKDKESPKEAEPESRNNTDTCNDLNNESKEPIVKSFRQNVPKYSAKPENQSAQIHQAASSMNAKTSNQVNTVNKEVSVKTFQSQTVIEEITTTVTKTIRTVKQEVKSASQTNTIPTIKTQKNMNYNNRQARNVQNMAVRHPSPSIGTKIKNATPPNKPSTSGFRPSNQLVPVRHGLNLTRPCNPTLLPTMRNVAPRQMQQKPASSRPLKISPQAMSQTVKRSSQESTTQFTCFKKPKDSFSTDAQTRCDMDGEGSMHLSTSQSRSDFTSTIKNAKGRSVVTATQMKSEMSATSHLSKLGNVSGLKIVKSSSSKQATQVEERIENPGAKRTMEALQKLQMQGLLVKRPRTDGDTIPQNDNDFSNSDSENDEDTGDK